MIRIRLSLSPEETGDLALAAAKKLRISPEEVRFLTVERRSVDARRQVRLDFTLRLDAGAREKDLLRRGLAEEDRESVLPALSFGDIPLPHRPVIIGGGPAGLTAAWLLAREGYRPLLLEQGQPVEQRVLDTEHFFDTGELNERSNAQFGEGGAGAFSDGKLNTRVRNPRCARILKTWADLLGAPEIASDARPHVGTDRLRILLPRLRNEIVRAGGTFRFGCRADRFQIRDGEISAVVLESGETIPAEAVILAPGHSARDLQLNLLDQGILLEPRPFAMGVRIEQDQSWLDRLQYGRYAGHPALGAASYSVSCRVGDVSVHSFCVCPGGQVVNASSENTRLCVNGMSNAARDSGIINGALVVSVNPPEGASPLWGVDLQRAVEHAAYEAGGGGFRAPAQSVGDFLSHGQGRPFSGILPSVRPGAVPCDLHRVLPESLTGPLEAALMRWDSAMPGFASPDAVLTAVEARTSSPVRLPRNEENGQSVQLSGLYPAGEGAGYAGGILSSAADGYLQAERLMTRFARPERSNDVG